MSKPQAIGYLRDLLNDIGLGDLRQIDDEFALLNDRLTGKELYAVARLLELCLEFTHNVASLPCAQARQRIKDCKDIDWWTPLREQKRQSEQNS